MPISWKKSGSWYAYNGAKIGQGRENAKQYLAQNPLICEEIENQVRELHGLEASMWRPENRPVRWPERASRRQMLEI